MCFLHTEKERPALTGEAYQKLLDWLNSQGESYQDIYGELAEFFKILTRCFHPQECTDETLDRVAKKIIKETDKEIWTKERKKYCFKTAKFVWYEYRRCELNRLISIDDISSNLQPTSLPEKTEQEIEEEEKEQQIRIKHLEKQLEHEQKKKERREKCTEVCLKKLKLEERRLFKLYEGREGVTQKIARKAIALALGISINALRKRVTRINKKLRKCVKSCLEADALNRHESIN